MKTKSRRLLIELLLPTADGDFVARYSDTGLAALEFPGTSTPRPDSTAATPPPEILRWHCVTSRAMDAALAGRTPEELPPLDLSTGTEFQRHVWQALRNIDCGQTRSYSEIAQTLGNPNATHAVGGACGANPIPVQVPCHRVLAAHARLGGFSGGLDWKRRLLEREGIRFQGQGPANHPASKIS
jgi:O-6-methylguanine DNA methyltransferase